jgi:enterochelin esterase-like enzyme
MRYFLVLLTLVTLPLTALAALERSQGVDYTFVSRVLPSYDGRPRTVNFRVIFPKGFEPNRAYPVVYFLHGRFGSQYNLDEMGLLPMLDQWMSEGGLPFLIVLPSGENHYWMNAALSPERWGDVVALELVEQIEDHFPVLKEQKYRLVAGISMGGHGAVQLSLNYPQVFGATASHSPRFRTEEEAQLDGFDDEFGRGEDYRARDPLTLVSRGKRFPGPLWMDIGGSDVFFANTYRFAQLLVQSGIRFEGDVGGDRVGGHDGGYWSYHLPTYLRWYSQVFLR